MKKIKVKKREIIQTLSSIITNGNLSGFLSGKIYKGKSKYICVPGLNCYSCPGALGSCPIGSLQAVIGGNRHNFSFYIFGILIIFGILLGRLICGFLCPFGFVQDLLYKIPIKKIEVSKKLDKLLRKLKYIILLLMVIILPMIITNEFNIASPYFCKYICPAGTLGGSIPLLIKNKGLRSMLGFLFAWKMLLLIITLVSSILIYRPFCKYICPLGAFYSFFNKFSFYKLEVNKDKCNQCGLCEKKCKMGVDIRKDINSLECIRCLECKDICNKDAITSKFNI